MKNNLEFVRGGQGRSARAVTDSAEVWGWITLAAVILALVCLTGCVCDTPEHKLQNMTQGN